jgi:hypothetical protein
MHGNHPQEAVVRCQPSVVRKTTTARRLPNRPEHDPGWIILTRHTTGARPAHPHPAANATRSRHHRRTLTTPLNPRRPTTGAPARSQTRIRPLSRSDTQSADGTPDRPPIHRSTPHPASHAPRDAPEPDSP